jgi:hypothetical protein
MLLASWALARHGHHAPSLAMRALAATVCALALARPQWLARANHALGRAVTVALLTGVYALVLAPTRVALALLRIDPLEGKSPAGATHWITRATPEFSPQDFERLS